VKGDDGPTAWRADSSSRVRQARRLRAFRRSLRAPCWPYPRRSGSPAAGRHQRRRFGKVPPGLDV